MKRILVLSAVLAALGVVPAHATQFTINVSMDGPQAGTASPGTGSATLILDDVADTLDVNMSYLGPRRGPS